MTWGVWSQFWIILGGSKKKPEKINIHNKKQRKCYFFMARLKNPKLFMVNSKKQDPAYSPHARFIVYRDDDDVFWGGSGYMMCFGLYVVYDNDAVWCFWLVGSRFFGPTPKQARSRSRAIPSRAVRAYTMPRKFPHAWEGH